MSGIDLKKSVIAYDLAIGNSITGATAGSILFAGAAGILAQDNANLFFDDTNNRLGLGINSSILARLHVKGSGATSATSSALFTNSAGTQALKVKDNLFTEIYGIIGSNTGGVIFTSDSQVKFNCDSNSATVFTGGRGTNAFGVLEIQSTQPSFSPVSFTGTKNILNVSAGYNYDTAAAGNANMIAVTSTITQSNSASGTINAISIIPTINQTGGSTGITRGLYINPTLTSAVDFRAIETVNGRVIFGNLPTSSVGLVTGQIWNNLGILTIV